MTANWPAVLSPIDMTILEFLHVTLGQDDSGHDEAHAFRVLSNALVIMEKEGGDEEYVTACCLLHDCLDSKLGLDNRKQEERVLSLLLENGYEEEKAKRMVSSMKRMSFHLHDETDLTLEDEIIRDADRLDALGEEGVSRVLAYSQARGRMEITEEDKARLLRGEVPHGESAVAHFYEKLLILDQHLYTKEGKRLGKEKMKVTESSLKKILEAHGIYLSDVRSPLCPK